MEQYQAQLVSAVRSSVNLSSNPLLLEVGLKLASKILISNILTGDRIALQRMFSSISLLLDEFKDLYYPSFAEWVACKIKIRLLDAHASIKCHVYKLMMDRKNLPDEFLQLVPLFSQLSSILGKYWISVLKDYCFFSFGLQSKSHYKPFLDGIQSLLVSTKVRACLDEACPLILHAYVLDAIPVEFEMEKHCHYDTKNLSKILLRSGYIMVRLDIREFRFVWGLTLLFLFRGQHSMSCSHVATLLYYMKAENIGGVTLEMTFDERIYEISLLIFQALSREVFFHLGYLTSEICRELLQVLLHADQLSTLKDSHAIHLLSQIVQFCPHDYFEMDCFISMASELSIKYLYRMFQRDSYAALSQDQPCEDDLTSLLLIAEKIANNMDRIKFPRVLLSFLIVGYECIKRCSTDSHLSKLVNFLQSIFHLMQKHFKDDPDFLADNAFAVLRSWVTVVIHACQDCKRKINIFGMKKNISSKLMTKKLAFFLEETVSIASLVYEEHTCGCINDKMLSPSLYKLCVQCIRMTLSDINMQVQAVVVHVLKNTIQKEASASKDHSFFMFFMGEILSDIFGLIQKILMEQMSWESTAILDECLKFLFVFHTLSQGSDSVNYALNVLLEAIFMVFNASDDFPSHELLQTKNAAIVLVSHLVQIPSYAIQIKEILRSMSIMQRQRLQDVIRASTSQGHMEVHTKSENPYPNIAIHVKAEHVPKDVSYSDVMYPGKVNDTNIDEDNDDDWDTFQSFPSYTAITENVDFSVLERKVHHNKQNFDPHHVPDN